MAFVCPSWFSFILYNPIRKAFTDRSKVLDESCITRDSIVLEIGAGNGFFTEAIAERAKKVIAVELQQGMVRKLRKRVQRFGDAVEIVLQDIASADMPHDSADVCLLYYSFHEIAHQGEAAAIIARTVRQNGVLSIYEPSVEVNRKDMDATVSLFQSRGFSLEERHDNLFTRFARLRKQ
ncbi:MAG: class I SAM-dependent methyltransferase [Nitrospirae bacterium]|nr:class I SAM-dependent methyltransferase [Nitrospirota bacterium]